MSRPIKPFPDYGKNDLRTIILEIMGEDALSPRIVAEILSANNVHGMQNTYSYFLGYRNSTPTYIVNNGWAAILEQKYPRAFSKNKDRLHESLQSLTPYRQSAFVRRPHTFGATLMEVIAGHTQNEMAKRLDINTNIMHQYTTAALIPSQKALNHLLEGLERECPATVHLHPFLRVYAEMERVSAARIKSGDKVNVALFRRSAGELIQDLRQSADYTLEEVEEALTHPKFPQAVRGKIADLEKGNIKLNRSIFKSAVLAVCEVFNLETVDPQRHQTLRTIAEIIAAAPG